MKVSDYIIEAIELDDNKSLPFRFTNMSSEHTNIFDRDYGLPYEQAKFLFAITGSEWYTYAWMDSPIGEIPIAVVDNNGKRLKFKKYQRPWVVAHPVWNWIAEERTPKQQQYINDNLDEIDAAFKQYILDIGF